jgi:hypothetical protein
MRIEIYSDRSINLDGRIKFGRLQSLPPATGGLIVSVRKRTWTTRLGEAREAWIVDYTDQQGRRHIRTFDRKEGCGRIS